MVGNLSVLLRSDLNKNRCLESREQDLKVVVDNAHTTDFNLRSLMQTPPHLIGQYHNVGVHEFSASHLHFNCKTVIPTTELSRWFMSCSDIKLGAQKNATICAIMGASLLIVYCKLYFFKTQLIKSNDHELVLMSKAPPALLPICLEYNPQTLSPNCPVCCYCSPRDQEYHR